MFFTLYSLSLQNIWIYLYLVLSCKWYFYRHLELGYKRTEGDEVEDMYILLREVKRQIPSVTAVCSGAIASDYQRLRVESVCSRLGLVSLAYLWKQDQSVLLNEMVNCVLGYLQYNWLYCMYAIFHVYVAFNIFSAGQIILTLFWFWPDCKWNSSYNCEGITCLTLLLLIIALFFSICKWEEFLCSYHMTHLSYQLIILIERSSCYFDHIELLN
jgi:hypothetical protein